MKKRIFLIVISLTLLILFAVVLTNWKNITGGVIQEHQIGPSAAEQSCMMACMKCSSPGIGCTGNQQECQTKCNMKKPEQTTEEKCVETCILKGCDKYDFSCQAKNQAVCDKECGMIKEPEAKSEEEQCIRDCINKENPGLICQSGEGGEKGNEICQRCAKECEHLYAGPCLNEEKLEQKKQECQTCEHCYGKPVMGDSGEGYQCIVSIECADSSGEFGDEPGTGPGIGQEGFVANIGDAVTGAVKGVVDFFKNMFNLGNSQDNPAQ